MTYENILAEKAEGIGLITINREEVRNAIDPPTYREIIGAMEAFEADEEVGAIILTGAGDKSFAAGSDIRQIRERTLMDGLAAPPQRSLARIEDIEKPVIAAINGFALGGGCELSMACDIRIAGENAKLGQPEVNLGIMPGAGGTQRLINLVGPREGERTHHDGRYHRRARGRADRAGQQGGARRGSLRGRP